jgi:glycosyltransferase involved in cell wall biosynthesis
MAAGCPVVGANRGGIPDIVSDGVNGCLYEPDQEGSLAAAVERLLGDASQRAQLRQNARQEAERWGWAGATDQLRSYYKRLLAHPELQLVA